MVPNDRSLQETGGGEILLYSTKDGKVRIDVLFRDESLWLTQKKMAKLFNVDRSVITKHLGNIFKVEELKKDSVCAKIAHTASDGKIYRIQYYNLDTIIAVGYRVNSKQATKFRIWATSVLREFIIKGFVLDTERLKNGTHFGKDYYDELLEKIREIRASERRFYQKITDIYAECSLDYDPKAELTKQFYATVQNKLHWAIHGRTAAELIASRADTNRPNMGLTIWKNAPDGKVHKSDVTIAKNYLEKEEIEELNRIVVMYLDYAELQASKHRPMRMKDWTDRLDAFLRFNEYEVLNDPGKVSHQVAKDLVEGKYEVFRKEQDRDYRSDFDRLVGRVGEIKGEVDEDGE